MTNFNQNKFLKLTFKLMNFAFVLERGKVKSGGDGVAVGEEIIY